MEDTINTDEAIAVTDTTEENTNVEHSSEEVTKSVVEDVSISEDTPAEENVPISHDMPIVEDVPISHDMPIVEDVPISHDMPIVEDVPISHDMPIVEDVPISHDMPIVEDVPISHDMPIVDVPTSDDIPMDKDEAIVREVPIVEDVEMRDESVESDPRAPQVTEEVPPMTCVTISEEAVHEIPESTEDVTSVEKTHKAPIEKVLSASQINEMFVVSEKVPDLSENEILEEEPFDPNPQVNIEDMKVVQDELREFDIHVCGSCHLVFHFVEEFKLHKPLCKHKSDFHGSIVETKPQVWAFLLWKNAQTKVDKRGGTVEESSWKLYQKWCKMPEGIRNAWVAAGEAVMNFSTFGYSKPPDPLIKPLHQPRRADTLDIDDVEEHKPVILKKLVQRDASGEIKEIKPTSGMKRKYNEDAENIRNQLEDDSSQDREMRNSIGSSHDIPQRVGFMKVHRVQGQDGQEDTLQEEEFVVEKIVSRRFNPRRKQYEYLLKWEGYPSEQNTWEPAENLEACQHLLKAFEDSLAKQSINKPKTSYNKKIDSSASASPTFSNYGGRPIRYSKQKALSQVKQWCGSIKPDDAELEMLKRKMPVTDSDDEDDPYVKKMRMERGSDSEDSMGPAKVLYTKAASKSGIIRRPGRPPLKPKITNGTTESLAAVLGLDTAGDDAKSSAIDAINRGIIKKSTGMSPHNQQVLVANAKGVVKVDPSQVPNLSSGVYIMSNKSGIIKLDSVTPSKALSLKGVSPNSVKQPSGGGGAVTSTTSQGVIVVNRENQQTPRSGVMRRPGGRGRGVGRPPLQRGNPSYRGSPNPNTRLIHSGSRGSTFSVSNANKISKTPIKTAINDLQRRSVEGERKILGPKTGRGFGRGGMRGGRGGVTTTLNKPKDVDTDNVFIDLPQENSSDSDAGLPDLFPAELPPMEPQSPPRPLTLCPETGKVLLKAEGEKSPDPTPPHSPKVTSFEEAISSQLISIKQEPGSTNSSFLKIGSSSVKDPLVKKTLKPGSIGSMSVSPKKSFEDNDDIVTISGEDGMLYKVRKSELTNSLLVGEDGQQCVYVTTGEDGDEGTVLTLDSSYADNLSQLSHVNILEGEGEEGEGTQFFVKEGEEGELVSLEVEGGSGDAGGDENPSQVVAQLVEASEPAPGGGPRRVVLLLPDGNLMMTEVDEEQYAALELDKYQTAAAAAAVEME